MDEIVVYQHAEDDTRTPDKACLWVAETTIDGISYTGRSRHGAVLDLARVLVAAGIPDADLVIRTAGGRGEMRYESFHTAAQPVDDAAFVGARCGAGSRV